MSERQRQTEFLSSLIRAGDTGPCRELQERLQRAQHDENSIRRKISALIVLGLVSMTGFGYTAIFFPEAFNTSFSVLLKLFCILGLGAMICLTIFLAWWLWYRALVNSLQEEGRKLVRGLVESRLQPNEFSNSSEPQTNLAPESIRGTAARSSDTDELRRRAA